MTNLARKPPVAVILTFIVTALHAQNTQGGIQSLFLNPPESAKPGVLWMWMGSNIDKQGITHDLEALNKEGFNRTTMFSLADVVNPWSEVIEKSPTPQIVAWTEPWWQLVKFAAEESKRLHMDFGMFNCPGYETSGGPWITPELSMQEICWSTTKVMGSNQLNISLAKPKVDPRANMPFPVYNPATGLTEKPIIPARDTFYRDIAVLALPANDSIVPKDSVLNITSFMQANGTLQWNAPPGDWVIYRFGHTTTGALLQPTQPGAEGLECDKMNVEAVSFHMDHIIGEIKRHLGNLVGTTFTHVHFDSYEAGEPTWTPKMKEEFLKRRGYDILTWLPTFAGVIINNRDDSAKFRDDFDETIEDLYRDVYFATVSKKLADAGLIFLSEPYGGPWKEDEVVPYVKHVMGEFWTDNGVFTPYEFDPTIKALRKANKNLIEAEAFTGQPASSRWSEYPAWLKPIGDAAFCAGVNRMVLHRFVHQPWDDKYKPGNTMGQWGTHFDRTQTWWKPAKAMVQYWQRCQALLQWGHFAAGENDFYTTTSTDSITINHIHRNYNDTDIYFIANTTHHPGTAECHFKISGRVPELWNAVTGQTSDVTSFAIKNGETTIPLHFDDAQSFFVVFKNKITATKSGETPLPADMQNQENIIVLSKPWYVQFDSAWGGPAKPVLFTSLQDWTTNAFSGIKYYSGTATYQTSFDIPAKNLKNDKGSLYLDLGAVKYIARVTLNNTALGVIWTAPWHIQIPAGLLKATGNDLQIEVTNTWANRLIGDEQQHDDCEWLPSQYMYNSGRYLKEFPDWFLKNKPRPSKGRYCFTTWNYFDKDSPLMPSGLLGPVKIVWAGNTF